MKTLNKVTTGLALSLTLGFAATASAHPGAMGGGMGPGTQGGQQHRMQGAAQHGGNASAGMQHGKGHAAGMQRGEQAPQAAQQLMTSEERTAAMEKMRNANTPEERQQIAMANRAEMQKRAAEKGITLPEQRGPQGRAGMGRNTPPASTEHVH